ncbi:hypothetical protein [Saccharothrix sp. NRRL B-16314]|uniref:hypothetical protein n=1 Tax=Saccharothrix sp. NRRL B-16314 TaxID=1463825 RepID=UPI00052528BF|nr:hypothetical protein [Saccharothrix sp. NRRL B-16314]
MRMNPRRLFGAATLLAVTTGGLFLGGTASATPTPVEPDPRAVIVEDNLEWNHPNVCAKAGLPGTAMDGDDSETATLPHTADGKRSITITGGLEGYIVTGVVVKGGNDSNVYFVDPPEGTEPLGELDWEKLVAPNNSSGAPADISHWFFCVEVDDSVTTTTTAPETTTPATTVTTTEAPGATTTTTPDTTVTTTEAPATTTTTEAGAVAGPGDDDLASTGFDGGWMLIVGLALVAAGAAFVASPKLRGLLRR